MGTATPSSLGNASTADLLTIRPEPHFDFPFISVWNPALLTDRFELKD
jgi:hypothetical protein